MIRRKRRTKQNKHEETTVHKQLLKYVRLRFPNVIFRTDGAGLKLTKFQSINFAKMQSCNRYPDLFFPEPRGKFAGLYIEIKKNREEYLKKDGTIRQSEKILGQLAVLWQLDKRGYAASFGGGFAECKKIVDDYFSI